MITVTLDGNLGGDIDVVRAARDSFGKTSSPINDAGDISDKDKRLIRFLSRGMSDKDYNSLIDELWSGELERSEFIDLLWKFRNTPQHLAPFGHCYARFKFKAPVFVMRHIVKHEYIRLSELSMRYVRDMPDYYFPESWRAMADDVKQGSVGDLDDGLQIYIGVTALETYHEDIHVYETLLENGLCPEQARTFLRLSHMTQGTFSGSLDALAKLCHLRISDDAQYETRLFAEQIYDQMLSCYPVAWPALMEGTKRHKGVI